MSVHQSSSCKGKGGCVTDGSEKSSLRIFTQGAACQIRALRPNSPFHHPMLIAAIRFNALITGCAASSSFFLALCGFGGYG